MSLRGLNFNSRAVRRYWPIGLFLFGVVIFMFVQTFHDKETDRLNRHKFRKIIDVYSWVENPTTGCGKNFEAYGEEFVLLRNARLNPKSGVFSIPCGQAEVIPHYRFEHGHEGTPLQTWLASMETYPHPLTSSLKQNPTTTIAVMRIEAHNLYHTMCEWYNVFLLSKLLDFDPSEIDILFLDDRPPSPLDETWKTLFKNVTRYSDVDYNSVYRKLIWNIIGYESPLNFHFTSKLPYMREFQDFYLSAFGIKDTKTLHCDKLTVTLFLRRDYMTHPERRNMTGGLVHRKFKNENEIIHEIKNVFVDAIINVLILEQISMMEQLRIVTTTDVLIGMHGAGMTHVLFLPRHAAVFEMFPKYWGFYRHFKAMARWRHIKYFGWQNRAPDNEFPDYYTRIPIGLLRMHCHAMKNYICGT